MQRLQPIPNTRNKVSTIATLCSHSFLIAAAIRTHLNGLRAGGAVGRAALFLVRRSVAELALLSVHVRELPGLLAALDVQEVHLAGAALALHLLPAAGSSLADVLMLVA